MITDEHITPMLGFAKQLPETDVDYGHVTSVVSRNIEDAIQEEDLSKPKPVTKTTSFYTMVGASLAGLAAIILTNQGVIGPQHTSMVSELLTPAIIVGMSWIAGKFIESRGKVSVAKVQLAQQQMALRALELKNDR